jgi:hypothetical protein
VTSDLSDRLVRLPLWIGIEEHQEWLVHAVAGRLSRTKSVTH